MQKYLSKLFYVLTGTKRKLALILLAFISTSVLEAFGIGLIGPFFSIASRPQVIQEVSILDGIYQKLGLQESSQFILILGLVIVVIFCVQSALYFLAQTYIYRYSFNQKTRLTSRLMKSYLAAPYTFYLKQNTAAIIKNILTETNTFTQNSLQALLILITNLIVTAVLLILLAYTSPLLLVMILGILVPVFLLFQRLGNKFQNWGQIQSQTQSEMVRVINHGLGGLKETRVIGCEEYFENQMDREAQKYSRAATLFQAAQLLPNILIKTCLLVFVVLFISLSQVFFKNNGQDLTAVMSVFAVASVRLIPASSQLIQSIGRIRNSSHALDMLYLDLKEIEKREVYVYKNRELLPESKNNGLGNSRFNKNQAMTFVNQIDLTNVTYHYPDISEPAVKDISLSLKKGESIALIGKSGAGKTTLVDVILGLLEPQSGDIQVDAVSVYDNIRSWQNLIGYIPQSIFLIDDTMERNIAFGVADAQIDSERLHKAIKAAQLEELVEQLPEGIKTSVGERGVRLSGGQRQRIGIARALYHEREILVLDEATAALDNETESRVTEAIKSLAGTKTMIIIAHRLTTVEHCDRVYCLERGRVVKSGSYQEVVLEG
ncbi:MULTISPECIES: ABC transporter ATP-binding protein [unclassified Coleofasciculus]|uniref:ABC transporter ATP-binding protein n=1 Tax=unclassified Coleofasciculus TaxID=2692782 RepID=UPI001881BB11|nr:MULTISPECIES: ABC transporter ATP-binding protein [unclassified Coleofasciculus]MBE9125767.1 ABC transporter ATP-binding protein [Coleofasciculus sp. LEGE 07081]MBE9148440.1 ABC transporter ATP-binding protein [Coleofasciculus sp. LEGE 07092]